MNPYSDAANQHSLMADENRRLKEYVNLLQQQFDAAVNREQQLLSQLTRQSRELEALQMELQRLQNQLEPTADLDALRNRLLDPAINMVFRNICKDLRKKDEKLLESRREIEALGFTPNSLLGQKLIAKCKSLQEENEMLGDYIANGRVQSLEMEVQMRRQQVADLERRIEDLELQRANWNHHEVLPR